MLDRDLWEREDLLPALVDRLSQGPLDPEYYGRPTRYTIAESVARQLGVLRRDDDQDDLLVLLWAIVPKLQQAILDGPPVIEHRGEAIVIAALKKAETVELVCIARQLQAGKDRLHELRDLQASLREIIVRRLATRVNKMLARWEREGVYEQHRPSPDELRKRRRERLEGRGRLSE